MHPTRILWQQCLIERRERMIDKLLLFSSILLSSAFLAAAILK